jgi:hypothetical protein
VKGRIGVVAVGRLAAEAAADRGCIVEDGAEHRGLKGRWVVWELVESELKE